MITLTSTPESPLDAILDWRPPTGITVESIEEPVVRFGETRIVLLDTISGSRQTVRIDPFSSTESISRLLRDSAALLLGKPAKKPRRKRKA